MMKKMLYTLFFVIATGCGYQSSTNVFDGKIVNIPYIQGDREGILLSELSKKITSSNRMQYSHNKGDVLLEVEILGVSNENIGYQRDQTNSGQYKKNIMAIEGRQKILTKVKIVSTTTNKILWGPETIVAYEDYDFVDQDALNDLSFIDSSNNRQSVLSFSLGQLESSPSAKVAAIKSLYKDVSQKIVDAILSK